MWKWKGDGGGEEPGRWDSAGTKLALKLSRDGSELCSNYEACKGES